MRYPAAACADYHPLPRYTWFFLTLVITPQQVRSAAGIPWVEALPAYHHLHIP